MYYYVYSYWYTRTGVSLVHPRGRSPPQGENRMMRSELAGRFGEEEAEALFTAHAMAVKPEDNDLVGPRPGHGLRPPG